MQFQSPLWSWLFLAGVVSTHRKRAQNQDRPHQRFFYRIIGKKVNPTFVPMYSTEHAGSIARRPPSNIFKAKVMIKKTSMGF
jgi:hypothetical protein